MNVSPASLAPQSPAVTMRLPILADAPDAAASFTTAREALAAVDLARGLTVTTQPKAA